MTSFRQILEDIPNCPNGGYLQALTRNNMVTYSAEHLEPNKGCKKCRWGHVAKGYDLNDYIDCHRPYVDSEKPNVIIQPESCEFWEKK
jgi:hypothetical protein